MTIGGMRAAWLALLGPFDVAERRAAELFEVVTGRYSEPHRHYHTLEHIDEVLRHVDDLTEPTMPLEAVHFAAWLHDVVYDPRRSDNEAASATMAAELLHEVGAAEELSAEVRRLIELTATHVAAAGDMPGRVVADSDLAILGAPPARYDRYSRAVRAEYEWMPDEQYREGRRRVLERFLARPAVFHTAKARSLYDAVARENMARELESLSRPSGRPLGGSLGGGA